MAYIVVAYVVVAYIVTAYIVMAHVEMADIVMACIVWPEGLSMRIPKGLQNLSLREEPEKLIITLGPYSHGLHSHGLYSYGPQNLSLR